MGAPCNLVKTTDFNSYSVIPSNGHACFLCKVLRAQHFQDGKDMGLGEEPADY
jgi:hypothetical protein